MHGCNELADLGDAGQERLCRVINGGLNGYPERLGLYEKAKEVLA
jgi:predicted chitinase